VADPVEVAAVRVLVGPAWSLPAAAGVEGAAGRLPDVPVAGRAAEMGIPVVGMSDELPAPRPAHGSSLDLLFSTSEIWEVRF
jgi:hypothetical protein